MTVAPQPVEVEPLVDVRTVADYLNVEPSWVYDHAAELGVRRLGSGPKARLRFSLREVDERLTACSAGRESDRPDSAPEAGSRRRRRSSLGTSVELLPIGGVRQRAEAAS